MKQCQTCGCTSTLSKTRGRFPTSPPPPSSKVSVVSTAAVAAKGSHFSVTVTTSACCCCCCPPWQQRCASLIWLSMACDKVVTVCSAAAAFQGRPTVRQRQSYSQVMMISVDDDNSCRRLDRAAWWTAWRACGSGGGGGGPAFGHVDVFTPSLQQ